MNKMNEVRNKEVKLLAETEEKNRQTGPRVLVMWENERILIDLVPTTKNNWDAMNWLTI